MNARRTDPSEALIPAAGQKRMEQYRNSASTDIRKTFAEHLAKVAVPVSTKPNKVKLSVARSKQ